MGVEENKAIDLSIEEFGRIARVTKVKPVESETPELIKQLQQKNVMVIALTARPMIYARCPPPPTVSWPTRPRSANARHGASSRP